MSVLVALHRERGISMVRIFMIILRWAMIVDPSAFRCVIPGVLFRRRRNTGSNEP